MSDERDKVVPLRALRAGLERQDGELAGDADRIAMIRRDFYSVTKQLRLGTAAQMIAAARELIDGEPGYLEHCRYLDELQLELESDSV